MSGLIDGFLDALAAERGAAKNTLEAYRRDLDVYLAFLARVGKDPLQAADADIRALQAQGAVKGLSPATVARRLSAIRQFHKHLFVEGLRGDDPTLALEGPRRRRPLPKTLGVAEVETADRGRARGRRRRSAAAARAPRRRRAWPA